MLLFLHPEVADDDKSRKLLRDLCRRGRIAGLMVDEVHLGLTGHWEAFRAGMLRKSMNVKAYFVAGAPLAVFSATLTKEEVNSVMVMAGRKKPMAVVAVGPLLNSIKICAVRRPSSQVPVLGDVDVHGREVPGLLHLLQRLVLNEFVRTVRAGPPYDSFKKTIIFFRNTMQMCQINGWLITELGGGRHSTSLFLMNHSSVSKSGQAVIQARINNYLLILTTSRMLLGMDVAGLKQVIMVRPPNTLHAVVQAGGRAGRLLHTGEREATITYVIFNDQDLGQNVLGMSDEVRNLCRSKDTCLQKIVREAFLGSYSWDLPTNTYNCCSVCDRNAQS